jgi:hypothetical protein
MLEGMIAGDAIRTVREKRSPAEDYLHTCVGTGAAAEGKGAELTKEKDVWPQR